MRVRSVSREEVWASAGVQGAWVGAASRCAALLRAPFYVPIPANRQPMPGLRTGECALHAAGSFVQSVPR